MTLVSASLRRAVFERAKGCCEYCKLSQETQVATFPVDHIEPISDGGVTSLENLALACPRCNATKWTHTHFRDPASGERTRIFNPRFESWEDHFQWSADDLTILEARTPEGRATLELMVLNSKHRRQVRHWLVELGRHPPTVKV